MAINSRIKGKVGELEACKELHNTLGIEARRSQQHCATDSASDIICEKTPGLWWEIKRVQKINVAAVMERSKKDCGSKAPVLLHRPNRSDWMVTVFLADLPAVIDEIQKSRSLCPVPASDVPGQDQVPNLGSPSK